MVYIMSVRIPGHEVSLSDPEDEEVLTDVVEYLDSNYAEPLEQGPIHLTGSAVYGNEPNDYDLVVQRQAKDERDFSSPRYRDRRIHRPGAVDSEQDDHIIASMMRDLSDDIAFDTYMETNSLERVRALMKKSRNVRPWDIGQPHDPESRYEVEIQGVDFDITFTPADPNKDSVELTNPHR
jgi:hypothetical protein